MWYGFRDILRDTAGLRPKSGRLRRKEFWAVDDVSFELKKGEAIGLIGPNGAGKTTILKMLNGIVLPDKGSLRIKGRVGALIQIGAGFHPQLTGRENIYINGAILGMGKREIDKKFEAIIEFADIGDFLDTPVKFYSSGMFVRLGFAVAAHCEPDVLLVDEVLAVGDMSFRRKCLNKMQELRESQTSIVFISHNLHSVDGICKKTIFLHNGQIDAKGETSKVIQTYQKYVNTEMEKGVHRKIGLATDFSSKEIEITKVQFFDKNRKEKDTFFTKEKIIVRVSYFAPRRFENPIFSVGIYNFENLACCVERTKYHDKNIDYVEGKGYFEVEFDPIQLVSGSYIFGAVIFDSAITLPYAQRRQDTFKVNSYMPYSGPNCGYFHPQVKWRHWRK